MKFRILSLAFILVASLTSAKAQNIVMDPGFESDTATDNGIFSSSIWSSQNATSGSYFSIDDTNPNSGVNEVHFGAAAEELDYVYQTLSTVIGTQYDVSFFMSVTNLQQGVGEVPASNEFVANIGGTLGEANGTTSSGAANFITGGQTLADVVNSVDTPYTEFTASFTAVDTSTNLIFGGYNGPAFDFLDNVSVAAQTTAPVPEPSTYGLLILAAAAVLAYKRLVAPVRAFARI
jgi:hypothetical protein